MKWQILIISILFLVGIAEAQTSYQNFTLFTTDEPALDLGTKAAGSSFMLHWSSDFNVLNIQETGGGAPGKFDIAFRDIMPFPYNNSNISQIKINLQMTDGGQDNIYMMMWNYTRADYESQNNWRFNFSTFGTKTERVIIKNGSREFFNETDGTMKIRMVDGKTLLGETDGTRNNQLIDYLIITVNYSQPDYTLTRYIIDTAASSDIPNYTLTDTQNASNLWNNRPWKIKLEIKHNGFQDFTTKINALLQSWFWNTNANIGTANITDEAGSGVTDNAADGGTYNETREATLLLRTPKMGTTDTNLVGSKIAPFDYDQDGKVGDAFVFSERNAPETNGVMLHAYNNRGERLWGLNFSTGNQINNLIPFQNTSSSYNDSLVMTDDANEMVYVINREGTVHCQVDAGAGQILDLVQGPDISNSGSPKGYFMIALSGENIEAYNENCTSMWTFANQTATEYDTIEFGDFDGDGMNEDILVGSADNLFVLNVSPTGAKQVFIYGGALDTKPAIVALDSNFNGIKDTIAYVEDTDGLRVFNVSEGRMDSWNQKWNKTTLLSNTRRLRQIVWNENGVNTVAIYFTTDTGVVHILNSTNGRRLGNFTLINLGALNYYEFITSDFDGDGLQDMAFCGASNNYKNVTFLNQSLQVFASYPMTSRCSQTMATEHNQDMWYGYFNDDNITDLFTIDANNLSAVILTAAGGKQNTIRWLPHQGQAFEGFDNGETINITFTVDPRNLTFGINDLMMFSDALLGYGNRTIRNTFNFTNQPQGGAVETISINISTPTPASPIDLISNTNRDVNFTINITDTLGLTSLDDASFRLNITFNTNTSESFGNRTNFGCGNNTIGDVRLFNCSIIFPYYASSGTWTINASIYNKGGTVYYENRSTTLTINALDSITLNLSRIHCGNSLGLGSSDNRCDDMEIKNTGNQVYGYLNWTAINLTSGGNTLLVGNFTVNVTDSTQGQKLIEKATGTQVNVTNSSIDKGLGALKRFFSFVDIPSDLVNGDYNSTTTWTVMGVT